MKRIQCLFLFCLAAAALTAVRAAACTTMIITPGASRDGSMMVAHSDDDELADQRLIYVPSKTQTGERKIFHEAYPYPRFVTDDRGPAYDTKGYPQTKPVAMLAYKDIWKILGREQETSFAYFDGNYGIMNEKNLMIGENRTPGAAMASRNAFSTAPSFPVSHWKTAPRPVKPSG